MTEKETKVEKQPKKQGSIWKGILQFFIFFVVLILCTKRGETSLRWWVILFEVILFRYCFTSYEDRNPVCDKDIIQRIKTNKKRWIRFIVVWFLRGRMMLWSYQWEWSEAIHNFQNTTTSNMEKWLDDLEQGVQNTTDKTIQELEEMK